MIAPVACSGHGPSQVKEAAASVLARVEQFESSSQLKRPEGAPVPLDLEWNNLRIDGLLGQGSFSQVYKARVKAVTKHLGLKDDRMFALKKLSTETICCNESFVTGAVDLALEAKILTKLHHENIIEVYGVKGGNIGESFSNSKAGGGFFIVMDLLEETLDQRLEGWRLKESQRGFNLVNFFNPKKRCQKRLQEAADRTEDGIMGVARGMEYIHSKNIILRDLKPQNVGFDRNGKVRIFDFGLARELAPEGDTSDLPRCNTGIAGTLRYISPENALGQPCGLSADVYSFAILLYEVITLQVPFSDIKLVSEFKDKVIRGRHRPNLKFVPSTLLQDLLTDSWAPNPNTRPSFAEIRCIMEEVISTGMLTQEGEWRKFLFKKTKPLPSCGQVGCGMKDHSIGGGSFRRSLSGSHHKQHKHKHHKHDHKHDHHHHHHHHCHGHGHGHDHGCNEKTEIQQLRDELKKEELDQSKRSATDQSKRSATAGSYHGSFNDQTRSFMENISFNSNRSGSHSKFCG